MNEFNTILDKIEVASSYDDVKGKPAYQNISGAEWLSKLMECSIGDKKGSHWIRTTLDVDDTNQCLGRGNDNAASLANILIIDCDKRINSDGQEIDGAPDPLQVSNILKAYEIAHILHGSHSYYTGEKGNRYRILLITKSPYNKEQLPSTAEHVVLLINTGLAKLGGDLLAYAKENNTWAQPWYYPRKPVNSLVDALYFEYLDGNPSDIIESMELPVESHSIHRNSQVKIDEISPIHAFNEQKNLTDALLHYGYKRVLSTKEYEKWLSPDSSSGIAGVTYQEI